MQQELSAHPRVSVSCALGYFHSSSQTLVQMHRPPPLLMILDYLIALSYGIRYNINKMKPNGSRDLAQKRKIKASMLTIAMTNLHGDYIKQDVVSSFWAGFPDHR